MGTWGTTISSNDTYEDVFSKFMDMYDNGFEPIEISRRIINENSDLIDDYEEKNNFWFALAMAQWQCNSLDQTLFQKVKSIIESGEDIKLWEELGANKKDIKKREKVLNSFLEKICTEKDKPRKRKLKVLRDSIFNKGDCLIYKLENGNYGGAFVLTSEKKTEFGMNMIAITTINQKDKPTEGDFEKAYVMVQKEDDGLNRNRDREMISWYYAQFFKKATIQIEVIGNLKVDKDYKFNDDFTSASQWDMLKTVLDRNDRFIEERGRPNMKIKLKSLRKNNWL